MSLKNRFRAFTALAMLGPLALSAFWLSQERSRALREKQEKVKNLVEVAHSLLAESYRREQAGMPRAEAQKQAILLLKSMRYQNDNYLWIHDFHPTMVVDPTKPQLDGTDLTGFKDPAGKALFVEMVETVRKSGSGFVAYQWPRPGADKPVPKISYVKGFEPWGWIIGTGIYIDDVDAIWRQSAMQAAAVMSALLLLLTVLGLSTYRRMFGPLSRMVASMKDLAEGDGDLSRRLEVAPDREVAELAGWFNTFIDKLQAIVVAVAEDVQHLAAACEQLSANSRQQAQGAEQQKDQIHQTATATQQMTVAVQQVTEAASRTAESARKSAEAARRGGKVVEETLTRMQAIAASTTEAAQKIESLGQQSEQIGRIIGVIDDIADQTNLLALNAAIEAARAGTQGRGFAVVADEVRKLAERTTKATNEIAQMIHAVQEGTRLAVAAMQAGTKEVGLGVVSTSEAGAALHEIIEISDRVGEMVSHIASAATEQAGATTEMNRSAECIAGIAAVAATGAFEATKALEDLTNLAAEIQRQVGQFRLDFKGTASAPGRARQPLARSAAAGS
jgi:methyl-accepting chemotaxis protein